MTTVQKTWPASIKVIAIAIIIYFLWLFNIQYITPLAIGFILAAVTYPLYNLMSKKISFGWEKIFKKELSFKPFSAIVTIILTSYIIVFFAQLITTQVIEETPKLVTDTTTYLDEFFKSDRPEETANRLGMSDDNFKQVEKEVLSKWDDVRGDLLSVENVTRVLDIGRNILGVVFEQILSLIVFFLAWYNALTKGKNWLQKITEVLPFSKVEVRTIKKRLSHGINNVLYASMISATIHSVIVFSIMSIFGSDYVWIATLITFLIGILPMSAAEFGYIIPVGTALSVNPIAGLVLIPILEMIVIYVNYIFIPKLIAADTASSPLLILTSVLSGVYIFGIMGFIIGPVIMIFVQTLWQILVERMRNENAA